jgi:protein gp37
MSSVSKIEWTESTWNPIVGCSIVSPGCTHCYAMRTAARLNTHDDMPARVG